MQTTLLGLILFLTGGQEFLSTIKAETTPSAALHELLVKRFVKLSPAEERLTIAAAIGDTANCTDLSGSDKSIRGDLLAWICTDPDASKQITYKGVSVSGAEIVGKVDLQWAKISFPARAIACVFHDTIDLSNGYLGFLNLGGSSVTQLNANGAHFEDSVFLRNGFKAEGGVDLGGARIGGDLDCHGGQFAGNETVPALNANGVEVKGNVFLSYGFKAEGGVDLINARIGEDLDCQDSQFVGNDKFGALSANSAEVKHNVFLRKGFKAIGLVDLAHARIAGDIELQGGHFSTGAQALALSLGETKTGGPLFNTDDGSQDGWPRSGFLRLDGFAYERIGKFADAKFQLGWIRRQGHDQFRSQPYEHLADVLRKMGLEQDACNVMIAKNIEHARYVQWRPEWLWYGLFGHLIGYGYSPWRAFLVSLAVIGIGWWLFRRGYCRGLITPIGDAQFTVESHGVRPKSDNYPKFNAFVYSLETFVPLLKLGLADHWCPNANRRAIESGKELPLPPNGDWLRVYLWCHIIAGWGPFGVVGRGYNWVSKDVRSPQRKSLGSASDLAPGPEVNT